MDTKNYIISECNHKPLPMNFSQHFKYKLAQAKTSWQLGFLGLCVGFIASLAIILLRLAIMVTQEFYMEQHDYSQLAQVNRFLLPFIGVSILLLIARISHQKFHRTGIPFVLHRQRKYYGYIPLGNSINQFFSALIAIASGFSVGREGPAVHLGAGSASLLAHTLRVPDNSRRILAACGIAAGISASFNSPLAAVVFVLEVVLQQYRIHLFLPIMVSALIGTAMSRMVFGNVHQYSDLLLPDITFTSVVPFIILGVVVGLTAVMFNRTLLTIIKRSTHLSLNIRLTLAAVIMATIGWFVPQAMGSDHGAMLLALSEQPAVSLLLLVCVSKFIATVCALGLGIPGGVIGVLYALGALLGSLIVWTVAPFFPELAQFAPMAVMICMVAMMATSLNAPLAALVAVLEMSENAAIIFPSLLVVVPAILLSQQVFNLKSLFFAQLDLQQLSYKVSPVLYNLQDTGVITIMRRKFHRLNANDPWLQINSSLPTVIAQHGEQTAYLMPSDQMGFKSNNKTLVRVKTLTDNATLAEAYQLLSPKRCGFVLIIEQGNQQPVGLVSWRSLRKHLHRAQG